MRSGARGVTLGPHAMSSAPSPDPPLPEATIARAAGHVADILALAIEYDPGRPAVIVGDARCALSSALTEAYRRALPKATVLDFDALTPEVVVAELGALEAGDLTVLVQSASFRLNSFRVRIPLFRRGLKVIEHPHLGA